jgi:hypothetical protein
MDPGFDPLVAQSVAHKRFWPPREPVHITRNPRRSGVFSRSRRPDSNRGPPSLTSERDLSGKVGQGTSQTPSDRQKRTCTCLHRSSRCGPNTAHRIAENRAPSKDALEPLVCVVCGVTLAGRRAEALHCSAGCRREAGRLRAIPSGSGSGPYRSIAQKLGTARRAKRACPPICTTRRTQTKGGSMTDPHYTEDLETTLQDLLDDGLIQVRGERNSGRRNGQPSVTPRSCSRRRSRKAPLGVRLNEFQSGS